MEIKILHAADQHVKHKDENNYSAIENNLSEIRNKIISTNCEIFVFVGDLFDNATPNDAERKLAYKFLGEILRIESLKEFVFMCGNHDILSDRKNQDISKDNNSFDSLNKFIETLAPELAQKVTYLKEQKQYISKYSNKLGWISYSLEDGMSNGNNIDWDSVLWANTYNISIFHDIVRDYIDDSKLPVRKDKVQRLPYVEDFKTELILAGDIHKNYTKTVDGKTFVYPGSTNQVSFSEGSTIKIRKNSTIFHADKKCLKLHSLTFNEDGSVTKTVKDIELDCQLSYINIDLDSNKKYDNFLEDIKKFMDIANFGLNKTIIKLKLSTVYISDEIEIYKLIDSICSEKGLVYKIISSYNKFSIASDGTKEDLLVQIDDESDKEFEFNIEDLKLTESRLNELFDKCLQKYVVSLTKDLNDENLVNEIISNVKTLFSEQISLSLSAIPNFNILLESIETKGFMGLEENNINLLIPGLTKINGTNGIGKTTLYNMIRYAIKGVVFDGLKANKKKQNTLFIFNDKLINQDVISVRLFSKINNTSIAITRIASRKWKANVTDEQKRSLEWKDYIADVSTSVRLDVAGKDGQKTFTGDEAENLIAKWFGDVASTILILNQQRILTMLNLQSDKLQEMVLDYIGVDYLNLLKENLPSIKNQYNLQKPKNNFSDLKLEYTRLSNLKNDGVVKQDELKNSIDEEQKTVDTFKLNIENKNDALLKFGNIPDLIKENEEELTTLTESKNSFVVKQKTPLPIWEEEQPTKPDFTQTDSLINDNLILLQQNLEKQEANLTEKLSLSENLVNKFKDAKNKLPEQIKELVTTVLTPFENKVKDNDELINQKFLDITNVFEKIVNDLKTKYTDSDKEYTKIDNDKILLENRIVTIDEELLSGICEKCNRAFGDDWESHKIVLEEEKVQKQKLIDELKIDLTTRKNTLTNIDNFIKLYEGYWKKLVSRDLDYFIQLPENGKPQHYVNIVEINDLIKLNNVDKVIVENLSKQNFVHFENHEIESLKNFYINVKKLIDKSSLIDTVIEDILKANIEKLKTYGSDFITLVANLEYNVNLVAHQKNYEDKIDELKTDKNTKTENYSKLLESYNERYNKHVEEVNKIRTENDAVEKHNDSINVINDNIEKVTLKKSNLELQLPTYNNVVEDITKLKDLLKESETKLTGLNTDKTNLDKDLSTIDNDITNVNKELENWMEYRKHSFIYSIYDKLVNTEFPDIIFEYYRQYLNNYLNILLSDLNFKLYWDNTGDLYMVEIANGHQTFRPVQLVSGMQTAFLGLSLIYTICMLNVKNNISHLFIDELSGTLNTGKELVEKEDIINFQEQFVLLINKFTNKYVWIIDHNINNMFETQTLEVVRGEKGGKYITV